MFKRCSRCGVEKDASEFNRNRSKSDGLNSRCRQCDSEHNKAWYSINRERRRETQKDWARDNLDKINAASQRYRERHPDRVAERRDANAEKMAEYQRQYYLDHLEEIRARNRQWSKKNPAKHLALCACRRALLLHCYAPWANREAIAETYALCRFLSEATGIEHHVDHIIPLRGKLVCGLHVENNLRIITAEENCSKHNRFDPALLE